jgi:protein-disulfide isomerase
MEEIKDPVIEFVKVEGDEKVEVTPKPKRALDFLQKNFLALSILTAGIMISGSVMYTGGIKGTGIDSDAQGAQQQQAVKKDVSIDDDAVLGKSNAPVTIIEFSDFQCPFCRTWWKANFEQLKKDYIDTGKVKFVYRDYPLAFHPMAEPSAQAAECAKEQNKYWEFHDKLFVEQDKLGQGTVTYTVNDLKKWASQIGLDSSKFNQCLDSGKFKSEIAKDVADATAAGVTGTPSFFINGRSIVGAQPYATFKAMIDAELKK